MTQISLAGTLVFRRYRHGPVDFILILSSLSLQNSLHRVLFSDGSVTWTEFPILLGEGAKDWYVPQFEDEVLWSPLFPPGGGG